MFDFDTDIAPRLNWPEMLGLLVIVLGVLGFLALILLPSEGPSAKLRWVREGETCRFVPAAVELPNCQG